MNHDVSGCASLMVSASLKSSNPLGELENWSVHALVCLRGKKMSHKDVGLLLISLVLIQGAIALILSYGLNGRYFKDTPSMAEAIRKLRADKPRTATVIGICYSLCFVELLIAVLHNLPR